MSKNISGLILIYTNWQSTISYKINVRQSPSQTRLQMSCYKQLASNPFISSDWLMREFNADVEGPLFVLLLSVRDQLCAPRGEAQLMLSCNWDWMLVFNQLLVDSIAVAALAESWFQFCTERESQLNPARRAETCSAIIYNRRLLN